jgi:hypothetical protein
MTTITHALTILTVAVAPLAAQTRPAAKPAPASAAMSAEHAVWMQVANYILQSAEDMPDAKFGYKPIPTVRSFGEIIGHVAGSQFMFCAAALGDSARDEAAIEKGTHTKAELIAAMKASNAYCAKAYAISDAAGRAPLTMFGQKQNRFWALVMNTAHNGESYGNIITYLRMNGMVPPSSK